MRFPIYTFFFACGYIGGTQLPYKFFPKLSPSTNEGITHSVYTSSADMVGKFRMFENNQTIDTKHEVASYIALNTT